ncbi:MAG: glycosyltransferase family 39 protein [Myxococcota bacterium]|nr:glycosyltransferase family 39 protein [Myxococcota bacterium]
MKRWLVVCMLLAVSLVWTSQWHWTQTIDEPQHLWSGVRILQQGDVSRFDNSKMPVSVLNAFGWLASQSPGQQGSWFWARAPQAAWLVGCMGLVFAWVRRLRGDAAGLAASALVGFDPNLMAHSGLVTTDLPCTFAFLLACFTWVRWLERPTNRTAAWAGAAVGAAQVAKFTALFLGPILGLVTVVWCVIRRTAAPFRTLPVVAAVGLFVLNAGYGFSGTGTLASDIRWKSAPFQHVASSRIPLPVPRPWIEGVDWVKHDDDVGQGRVYSLGERTHFGRPDHYLNTLPRKFPIPLMVLSMAGLVVLVRRRPIAASTVTEVIAPVFLLLWFSLAFNSQVGSRYVLPVVPFLVLLASHVPVKWVAVGALYTIVSGLTWWPWGLSYFNESVSDRSQAWRIVADSDLDWGQSDGAAEEWLRQNNEGAFNPDVPTPGPVLVGASRLTGVMGHPALMACHREHLVPTKTVAGGLYPLDYAIRDFAACFPSVEWSAGGGTQPAGEYLVVIRGRGPLSLTVGTHRFDSHEPEESLLGAVVIARSTVDLQWSFPEAGAAYINGVRVDGVDAPD